MLPYQTLITIDTEQKTAIYEQIAIQLVNLIVSGKIPAGSKLPSSRVLAALLNFHRKTIVAAYEELLVQGWISSKSKSGYYVNTDLGAFSISKKLVATSNYPDKSPVQLKEQFPPPTTISNRQATLFIDDGLPDARIAPYKSLLRELKTVAEREYLLKGTNYGTVYPSSRLKDALVPHLANSRGINHRPANLLITNGAQMGIYLIGKALISPGDVFLVGYPGYSIAKLSLESNGARTIDVPVDAEGIDVGRIEELCRQEKVKGVYVIPHHHYPTTAMLSPERRNRLLDLSNRYNFVIIEDDYDFDFHYSAAPYLPMASYNHGGRVIYVGSLSKCFSPSVRLGFVVGPEELIHALGHIRKSIDIRGDMLMEHALAALFENGDMDRHLRKSNKLYWERRDYMCRQLDTHLSEVLSYQVPSGGMAIWLTFSRAYAVRQIAHSLRKQGILFNNIVFDEAGLNSIRLGFAALNFQEIDSCIKGIQTAIIQYGSL